MSSGFIGANGVLLMCVFTVYFLMAPVLCMGIVCLCAITIRGRGVGAIWSFTCEFSYAHQVAV